MNQPFEYRQRKGNEKTEPSRLTSLCSNLCFAGFIIIIVKWLLGGQIYIPFLDSTLALKTRNYGLGWLRDLSRRKEKTKENHVKSSLPKLVRYVKHGKGILPGSAE